MASKMGDINPERTLAEAFRVFDRDGDGTISVKELSDVMRELGEAMSDDDIKNVMSGIDANSDGRMNLEEFSEAVTREARESGYNLSCGF